MPRQRFSASSSATIAVWTAAALVGHVAPEHRRQAGVDLEEPSIEQGCGVIRDWRNDGEAVLNELDLCERQHWYLLLSFDTQCDVSGKSG
jgi:hypothetical protein